MKKVFDFQIINSSPRSPRLRGEKLFCFVLLALMGLAVPAFANHGSLVSNVRDGWIDARMQTLVDDGVLAQPTKSWKDMTNLEMVQLTKKAAEIVVAQADILPPPPMGDEPSLPMPEVPAAAAPSVAAPPPAAASSDQTLPANQKTEVSKGVKDLVDEFKEELSAMDVDVAKLEDRIYDQEHRAEKFGSQEQDLLKRTGTALSGFSRGYFNTYRGYGLNRIYSLNGPPNYNGVMFVDAHLKSVPVPFVLFDLDLRFFRSIGMYYADPLGTTGIIELKNISLTNTNEVANLTAGDFYLNYTPLTLWNSETPVRTFVEPTSYYRTRKDEEEMVDVNHGPQWRLRGFQVSSDQALGIPVLSSFHLQAMGGELKAPTAFSLGQIYGGSQDAIDFFEDNLEFKGTGLILMSDTSSSNAPYIPGLITTYAKRYEVGSLSSHAKVPLDKDFNLSADGEWAVSRYQDDVNNPQSLFQDWALLANGSINYQGVHLTAKYLNNGAYFYSPGAQTNRFDAALAGGFSIYDDGLNGYGTTVISPQFNIFSGVNRPSFASYDRMTDNMLPYGDATPNREGTVLGLSADIGKDGWLKPQASLVVNMREVQPDYVLTPAGNSVLAVDTNLPTTYIRTFSGYEGALSMDLAKALEGTPSTFDVAADYKHQTTDLADGYAPFIVNTMVFCADIGPIPSVPLFDGLILSAAFERAQSTGNEYVLTNVGSPSTLAAYASYLDSGYLGTYQNSALNIIRTSWAFGVKYPISKDFEVHGDCFLNHYEWADVPNFERRDQIWRVTYEVSF